MATSYQGMRKDGRPFVCRRDRDSFRTLDPRLDLYPHSPDGFEWGYPGSGPAQLALAILADHLGNDRRALFLHQRFKDAVIALLPRERWTLPSRRVDEAISRLEEPCTPRP